MTAYRDLSQIPLMKYGLIMADPPWAFDHWGQPGERSAGSKYQTMTFDEIAAIRVGDMLTGEGIVWLWITPAFAHRVNEIWEAWRIKPVTMGWWLKTTKSEPIRPAIGTGHVMRETGEPYFIGKIGDPRFRDKSIRSTIMAPRGRHSEKPEEAYRNAERLAHPQAFRLDLFSRKTRPGWDSAGNEAGKFDEVEPDHG
ncbi:MT-A70 family methyltransferase [Maritimibacter sp. DP1N21-5]|uniref:MT-A70 family methyltransferase n=1 Tax=Maritimibacter sp. DP1N21-5 TaxID=2836867 RepID=UPI001C472ADD|nr:MT-A70 family methyltransferase [Maritimibacter sp. DP1N21-5]MBV7408744.1 DNA methyltransferase [Maritimibacter sp. DP1N21-5]